MAEIQNKNFKALTEDWVCYLLDLDREIKQVREMVPGYYALGEVTRNACGMREIQVHGIELLALTLGYFITIREEWSEQYDEHSFIYETKDGPKVKIFELKPRALKKSEDAEENKEGGTEE